MSATADYRLPRRSFLYSDVAAELRTRIGGGAYGPGSRLPSLGELMDEFGVSAITVRRALRELAYEGLILGHQGLGVFVKEKPKIHRVLAGDPERTIGDEISRAGFKARIQEISYGTVAADADVAARLEVPKGTRLIRHAKMSHADAEVAGIHTLHMPQKLARQLRADLAREYIFRVLELHRIDVVVLRCAFSAVPMVEEQARLFGLPPGTPAMRVDYTPIDSRGRPVLIGQTICRADRFIFEVNLPRSRKPRKAARPRRKKRET